VTEASRTPYDSGIFNFNGPTCVAFTCVVHSVVVAAFVRNVFTTKGNCSSSLEM
jgi:hypothetical protein